MEMIVDEKAAGKQLRPLYLIKPLIARGGRTRLTLALIS